MLRRRTQVVKGSVCKTDIHRFKSGRRLSLSLLTLILAGCGQAPPLEKFSEGITGRIPKEAPPDLPDWSKSQFIEWYSVRTRGERVLIIDVGGGAVDSMLDDESVESLLNSSWKPIFLHPRARPSLTHHLGWPSVTFLDDQGCLRATGSPTSLTQFVALEAEASRAREAGEELSLPAYKHDIPTPPEGGGTWTADDPSAATVFVQPDRGAPAVIWQDKPWVFGNRTDAEKFADRPAGRAFLDDLPDDHMYLAKLGPYISCPLPIPPPEPAPSSDKDANQAAGPASGG